jgi:hypothetical protein
MRLDMPRKRKYDYQTNYPVKIFLKLPVSLVNDLENLGLSSNDIEKIVEKYLLEFVENNRKNID